MFSPAFLCKQDYTKTMQLIPIQAAEGWAMFQGGTRNILVQIQIRGGIWENFFFSFLNIAR